jgi:two-component system catabolic regulation response regulator CreB/two-component system response regulator ChvI
MLIDDERDIITTFKEGLEGSGFSVTAFQNPFEALATFKKSNEKTYDLLLIDIRYDGLDIDGFQLYQELRNSGKKLPPVCFITAFEEYYDRIKHLSPEIDVKCFIRKPIQMVDLIARLKQELQA